MRSLGTAVFALLDMAATTSASADLLSAGQIERINDAAAVLMSRSRRCIEAGHGRQRARSHAAVHGPVTGPQV